MARVFKNVFFFFFLFFFCFFFFVFFCFFVFFVFTDYFASSDHYCKHVSCHLKRVMASKRVAVILVYESSRNNLYNLIPLKPHFYIVELGFTGVYTIFLISAQGKAVLTSTHNLCFEQKYEQYLSFLSENFHFLEVKFSIYLNRRVFVMLDVRSNKLYKYLSIIYKI